MLLLLLLLFPMLVKALYILISFIFHVAVGEILNVSRDVLQWVVVYIPISMGNAVILQCMHSLLTGMIKIPLKAHSPMEELFMQGNAC